MSRAVLGLSLIYAVRMLGLFMVLPILSLALEDYENASATLVGLALGVYGATQGLLQLPLAAWSDRIGRKSVITLGLVVFCVGSFVAAAADSVAWVVVGRALQGSGAVAATVMALLADLVPEERRGRAMASVGASIGLAFGVAMVVGPILFNAFSLSGVFTASGVLALVAIVILWWVVPKPKRDVFHNDVRSTGFTDVVTSPELLRAALGVFVLHAALMAMFLSLPVLIERLDVVSLDQLSWFYLIIIGSSFVFMVPLIIMAEVKRRMRASLRVAVILVFLSGLGLLFAADKIVLVTSLWWFFVGFNLAEALLPSLVSKIAPVGRRGAAMGVYTTAQFGGAFVGAVAAGVAMDLIGIKGPFVVAVVLSLVWLVAVVGMKPITYLKNDSLSMEGLDRSRVSEAIQEMSGIEAFVFDEKSNRLYLKVNADTYTRSALLSAVDSVAKGNLKN